MRYTLIKFPTLNNRGAMSVCVLVILIEVIGFALFGADPQWTKDGGAVATGTSSTLSASAPMLPPMPATPAIDKTDAVSTNAPVTNSPPPAALVSATLAPNTMRVPYTYSTAWWTNQNYTNLQGKVGPAVAPLNYFTVMTNATIAGLTAYIASSANATGPYTVAFAASYTPSLSQISFTDSNAAPRKYYRAGYFFSDTTP